MRGFVICSSLYLQPLTAIGTDKLTSTSDRNPADRLLTGPLRFSKTQELVAGSIDDDWFIEYLDKEQIRGKAILHVGTGRHHSVGLGNHYRSLDNEVLGVTVNAREHSAYVNFIEKTPGLEKTYKVLLADMYCLTELC